ncbi:MAG: L-threonylcarbamoyladenylate synthase [Cellulosilyticaceae bacterium]
MNTLIINDTSNLNQAASIIQAGGLVAVPTETVYGLAANALDGKAVSGIYKAKGRPSDNPLIVHIASLDMLDSLVKNISPKAKLLIDAFWPGPLTLIFEASDLIPKEVCAGLSTVAIRFPSHPVICDLIKLSGVPLAAPSANTSGKPSPTNATRVIDDLFGKVDAIIDGGDCSVGLESTVVATNGEIPTILRPGGVTESMLRTVVDEVAIDPALIKQDSDITPISPGMKYTHYSPNAQVIIIKGDLNIVAQEINERAKLHTNEGKTVGVLATDETLSLFNADQVLSVGSQNNLNEIAANLFEVLRHFDDFNIDIVYSLAFPSEGIGKAIMNRLEKSAGYNIIDK